MAPLPVSVYNLVAPRVSGKFQENRILLIFTEQTLPARHCKELGI